MSKSHSKEFFYEINKIYRDGEPMRKPKGKFRCISQTSVCPTCKEALLGNIIVLGEHYQIIHGRLPTDGEIYQFRTYKKKEIPLDKYAEYSGAYCKNSFNEVSGGLPSLGKKRR